MCIKDIGEMCECVHEHHLAPESISEIMPPEEKLSDMSELFKIFGDPTRIKILYLLNHFEMCVCDIADALCMSQPAVSYQLKVLKNSRLVKNRREGKTIFYSLADAHVETIIGMAIDHLEE